MLSDVTHYTFAAATVVALLAIFRVVDRLGSPRRAAEGGGNVAYLLVQAGHVAAVLLLAPGVVQEALSHDSLAMSVVWAAVFGVTGVVLIQLIGEMGIRLLFQATLKEELDTGNVAAGVAAGANYVAVGILAAPAIAGSDLKGLGLSLSFFALAVVTQAVYVVLFRALTIYDDSEQIRGENLAAALSYAGVTVAVSLVLARALTGGEFEGWGPALLGYAGVAGSALALYPARQLLVAGLVMGRAPTLRGGALDQAIGVERNTGIAALEALAYVAASVAIVQLH